MDGRLEFKDLESWLRDSINRSGLISVLDEFNEFERLAENMQKRLLKPLVKLAEFKGLDATFLFAKSISLSKVTFGDYLTVEQYIDSLKLLESDRGLISEELHQLALVFTPLYSFFSADSLSIPTYKGSIDLIDLHRQERLRKKLIEYIIETSNFLAKSILKYAKIHNMGLKSAIANSIQKEKRATLYISWKSKQQAFEQSVKDAEKASRRLIGSINTLDESIERGIATTYRFLKGHQLLSLNLSLDRELSRLIEYMDKATDIINFSPHSFYHIKIKILEELEYFVDHEVLENFEKQLDQHRKKYKVDLIDYNRLVIPLKESIARYVLSRDCLDLLVLLSSKAIFCPWNVLIALSAQAKEFISTRYKLFTPEIFADWSNPMFEHIEELFTLHLTWVKFEKKPLNLSLYFYCCSSNELKTILEQCVHRIITSLKILDETYCKYRLDFYMPLINVLSSNTQFQESIELWKQLHSRRIFSEPEILFDLPPNTQVFIKQTLRELHSDIFTGWTYPMFCYMKKLYKLHLACLEYGIFFNSAFYFSRYSLAHLEKIFQYPEDTLLSALLFLNAAQKRFQYALDTEKLNIHILLERDYFFKPLIDPNRPLRSFILQMPQAYFYFVIRHRASAICNFLFFLPDRTKKLLFKCIPTEPLLRVIEKAATHPKKWRRKRYQLLFELPEVLLKPQFEQEQVYQSILTEDWKKLTQIFLLLKNCSPAQKINKFSQVFSEKGISCHNNNYCVHAEQLTLDIRILPFIQALLIRLKRSLPKRTLNWLCSPWFIRAYSLGILKVEHLVHCTPTQIKELNEQALEEHIGSNSQSYITVLKSKKRTSLAEARTGFFKSPRSVLTVNPYVELLSP